MLKLSSGRRIISCVRTFMPKVNHSFENRSCILGTTIRHKGMRNSEKKKFYETKGEGGTDSTSGRGEYLLPASGGRRDQDNQNIRRHQALSPSSRRVITVLSSFRVGARPHSIMEVFLFSEPVKSIHGCNSCLSDCDTAWNNLTISRLSEGLIMLGHRLVSTATSSPHHCTLSLLSFRMCG